MSEEGVDINQRIATRVRDLRRAHGLGLDALASKSGVSRSMISLIERGESSPTAVLLDKLAVGLGVTLGALFNAPEATVKSPPSPVARRKDQPEWKDPDSGYVRRNVSPQGIHHPIQVVEAHFPPGARVAFETSTRSHRIHQQIWILEGTMEVTVGEDRHRLHEGDCLAMELDQPIRYHNPTRKPARYAVVITDTRMPKR
jgi:transcriptional regulator with XRE-family HTH domain